MMGEIKLYLFVLSLVYVLRFVIEFTIKFFQENPTPLQLTKLEQTIIYFTISYIITFFII